MSLEIFSQNNPLIVGIDPGDQNTGIAIWDNKDLKFIQLMTKTFWETIGWMNEFKEGKEITQKGMVKNVTMFIENPSLNKPVFPIPSETGMFDLALRNRDKETLKRAIGMFGRRAQNIGMNKKLSQIMIDIAQMKGYQVKEIRPQKKKLNSEEFNKKTGWQGRSSQHARDAARLVFPV